VLEEAVVQMLEEAKTHIDNTSILR
jgi:hypothetical protein